MNAEERDRLYKAIRGRLSAGDSIKAFAGRIGLSRTTIYSWTGPEQVNPEWATLRLVAHGLGLEMWELVREIEHPAYMRRR